MKKRALSVLLCAAMVFSLAACGGAAKKAETGTEKKEETTAEKEEEKSAEDAEQEAWEKEEAYGQKITIGFDGGVCTSAPVMANLLGYYKDLGIEVEISKMSGNTAEAIGSKKVDVGVDHIAYFLVPIVNGMDIQFVTPAQIGCKSLYVLADSGINSTKDLVGKKVGIPAGYGSFDHNIALRFFQRDGYGTDEVEYTVVESSAATLAMQNGELQACILGDQYAYKFVKDGTLKMVRSITYDDDFKDEPCCVIAFNRTFKQNNPITTKKLTEAIKKASDWIYDNPEEAADIMLKEGITSGDKELIVKLINDYNFKVTDEMCETALKSVIEDYKKFGLIDKGLDSKKVLEMAWDPVLQEK